MRTAAVLIILGLAPVSAAAAPDDGVTGQIAQARRLADVSDHQGVIGILEDALIEAKDSDRRTIVEMLKRSYMVMASRAQSSGHSRTAAHYRDNLEILEKATRLSPGQQLPESAKSTPIPIAAALPSRPSTGELNPTAPSPEPVVVPKGVVPLQASPVKENQAPNPINLEPPPLEPAPPALAEPPRLGAPVEPRGADPKPASVPPAARPTDPAPVIGTPATPANPKPNADLSEADRLFRAKQFIPAGQSYAALARDHRLPKNRVDHWAYCRWVAVVAALNAQPRSTREWDAIEAEVASIQRLAPGNWYGEYLRGKVAEIRGGKSRPADRVVIRGSDPDEARPSRLKRLFGRGETNSGDPSASAMSPTPDPAPALGQPLALPEEARAPEPAPTPRAPSKPDNDWEIHDTTNFRVYHHDALLAARAAEAAESVRARQTEVWCSRKQEGHWTPRCEIYLYPDGKQFAKATGQPESSPGFSTMSSNGQSMIGRKVSLRADHPQLLSAILPHEVTHVVLADLFTTSQIPRWADEGIAVLAEPPAERDLRASELEKPLESGRIFNLATLMAMDYPAPQDWNVYYAQSVSLTRFLVDLGAPAQFIEFVRRAHDGGIEPALREIYQIDSLASLEDRWLSHARRQFAARTAPRSGQDQGETLRR